VKRRILTYGPLHPYIEMMGYVCIKEMNDGIYYSMDVNLDRDEQPTRTPMTFAR
jgi:hypothetical protein